MAIVHSNNPAVAAGELLNYLGHPRPNEIDLEEVVWGIGAIFKEAKIDGSDGRILMSGDNAIITVNSSITYPGKRNFVIAHEIGHLLLHKNITKLFSDNDKSLSAWFAKGPHEQQANEFATELLMPAQSFVNVVSGQKLGLQLMRELATFFQVSLTNAFLRYRHLGDFPLMILFIENGLVKWKQLSNDFPFQYLPLNSKVPAWTVAGDYFYKKRYEELPEQIDAIEWFPEDYKIKYQPETKLWEQCFKVSEHGIISCLWTF